MWCVLVAVGGSFHVRIVCPVGDYASVVTLYNLFCMMAWMHGRHTVQHLQLLGLYILISFNHSCIHSFIHSFRTRYVWEQVHNLIWKSVCLSVYLSFCPSVCLSIHLYILILQAMDSNVILTYFSHKCLTDWVTELFSCSGLVLGLLVFCILY